VGPEVNPLLQELRERVSRIPPVDAGHDFHHVLRVAGLAEKILREECLREDGR